MSRHRQPHHSYHHGRVMTEIMRLRRGQKGLTFNQIKIKFVPLDAIDSKPLFVKALAWNWTAFTWTIDDPVHQWIYAPQCVHFQISIFLLLAMILKGCSPFYMAIYFEISMGYPTVCHGLPIHMSMGQISTLTTGSCILLFSDSR